jgi:Flp pilus assembly protein TadG
MFRLTADRERGQILPLLACVMVILLGLTGLAIDYGMAAVTRSNLQSAADAAALAAAQELPDPAGAVAKARDYTGKNGFTDGTDGVTVSVVTPYNGDPEKIEVTITSSVPTAFMRALGIESTGVSARAVATCAAGAGDYAVVVLDDDADHAFSHTGSGNLTITDGGGIMVNSESSTAIFKTGSGDINVEPAPFHYYAAGDIQIVGSGDVNPWPSPRPSRIDDPLADMVPPVPGTPAPGSEGTPSEPKLTHILGSSNHTLYAGTYYGGLKISGSGNVTMEPGVYIMAGGGLEISGSGNIVGDGVLIYNTEDPEKPTGPGAFDRIDISGSGNFDLTAPASGSYQDMLIWQDPGNTEQMRHQGSGNLGDGIIYLPSAELHIAGSGSIGSLQIIVDKYTKTGSGNVTIPFQAYVEVSVPRIALVE